MGHYDSCYEEENEIERSRERKEFANREIMKILAENGIKMSVCGCGCCGSPLVKFEYNGKVIQDDDNVNFDMFDGEL